VIGADEVDATPVRLDPRSGMPFPDDPGYVGARLAQAGAGAFRVLHLGDSMVFGTGVARAERFDSLLASLEPGTAQVNAGVPGTGPDYALLAMRSFVKAARFDLVIEHVFVGNDLEDIHRVYAGCGGPLLEYRPEGPRPRCFAWGEGRGRLADPPPWPLRIATSFSTFARQACGLWLGARVPPPGATVDHLGAILSAMRDEARASGSRFAVVLLPVRTAIEDAVAGRETVRAGRTVHRDIASRARAEGIEVLDAWGLIEDAVRREGAAPWFLRDRPDEPHLSAKGQALFAEWLDRGLRERGLVPSPQETEFP
jgi:lysophospholipase L1-like esterase